jgi:hypothetical protein
MTKKINDYCKKCAMEIRNERRRGYERIKTDRVSDEYILKLKAENKAKIEKIKRGDFEPEAAYI